MRFSSTSLALVVATGLAALVACRSSASTDAPRVLSDTSSRDSGNDTSGLASNSETLVMGGVGWQSDAEDFDELLVVERGRTATGFFSDVSGVGDLRARSEALYDDRGGEELAAEVRRQDPLDLIHAGDIPGCGGLLTVLEERKVIVPLERTDVSARIQGPVASARVTQRFVNPFEDKIEAVYVFPLPTDAAVSDFVMTIGERRIRGIIREREEAQRIYEQARAMGHVASLMSQERPNIFTQRVANIEPGKAIDVEVEYFHPLAYADGWYEFVFPMVVGPRYNPQGSTGGIAAVAHGERDDSGQPSSVPYLRPNERSGHDIQLSVEIDAGAPIEGLECNTHPVVTGRTAAHLARVELAPDANLPNKDFVLRYSVAGEDVRSALVTQAGYALLTLHPPADLSSLPRQPLELIFVVDGSGSMKGEPLSLVKRSLRAALNDLTPEDSFQIIRFSNRANTLSNAPITADSQGLRRGRRMIDALRANGGTEMMTGIEAALGHRADPRRERLVVFLTDGFIGNEEEILGAIARRNESTRIFSLGIGSSPNRFLLSRMASEGDGTLAFIGLEDDAEQITLGQLQRMAHPALVDLSIDWGGARVLDVYPSRLPDLFSGRPLTIVARCDGDLAGTRVAAVGRVAGALREVPAVNHDALGADTGSIASGSLSKIWARSRIADLHSQWRRAPQDEQQTYPGMIREVALQHGLLSQFTSFVAVDSLSRTDGEAGREVPVPVPTPAGVEFESTLGHSADRGGE